MFLADFNVDLVPIGLALKSVIMCMKLKSCVKLEVILKVCPKPHTSVLNTFAKCVHTEEYCKMQYTIHAIKMVQNLSVERWMPYWGLVLVHAS